MSDRMSWAQFQEAHRVTGGEEPAAFAAYLHYLSDGNWDGEIRQVGTSDEDSPARGDFSV
ncbi:hypothetical protein GCM10009749_29360 [Agromyces neolithicus]|uniref:YozE SAM-like domain-containing protein n=1 Tax=Agromyces neolithicus TaxID=269420 RepID=A0ABP4YHD2_9MICO